MRRKTNMGLSKKNSKEAKNVQQPKTVETKTELLNKLNSDFNSDLQRYTAVRKA